MSQRAGRSGFGQGAAGASAGELPADLIRTQLQRMLESRCFSHTPRLSRLLRWIVECALCGDEESLKEAAIAVAVFDKSKGFDPALDPIVRVEAGRLRERMRRYYRVEGRSDPVIIVVPKGGYRPQFRLMSRRERPPARRRLATAPTGESRIVILPFRDLSPAGDHAYLAEGIVEDLIAILSRDTHVRVVARRSSRRFANGPIDVQRLASELDADFVVEGSVRTLGSQLRMCVRMAHRDRPTYLWSETFDFRHEQIAAMRDVVGEALRSALARHRPETRLETSSPVARQNAEAYLLALRGRYHVRRRGRSNLLKGVQYLEQALQRDPHSAAAFATLAEAYALLVWYGFWPPAPAMPKARWFAERAVELQEHSAHAHLALGLVRELYEWEFAAARKEFERACELDPGDAHPWFELALCASRTGRTTEGLQLMRRAVQLEPLSSTVHTNLGVCLYYERNYDGAVQSFLEALDLNENYFPAHFRLGAAYLQIGKLQAAISSLRRAWELCESCPTVAGLLGYALAAGGEASEARQLMARIRSADSPCYNRPTAAALIHLGLRETSEALALLEQAFADRDAVLVDVRVDPIFDALRREDRFQRLVSKLTGGADGAGMQS